jgi:flagellar hook-associated protein 2
MSSGASTGSGLIQALGIGSGLDIQSLVTQLVQAERAPTDSRLTRQSQDVATQLSALGTLQGALSSFQSALSPLASTDKFALFTATVGNTDVLSATADASAVPGNYSIEVRQLAQPEQLISAAQAAGAGAVVGYGSLTLQLGTGASFTVTLDSAHNTLADIRDAINSASDNAGINATLVYGINGAQLVLTSSATGADQTIQVSASGGDGGLASLAYAPGATGNYTEQQTAQDAIVLISGVEHHSASNVVDGAIDGVTLTLKTTNTGAPTSMAVAGDQAGVVANIQQFVSAYNALQGQLGRLGSYDATSKTAGPMFGDWLLNSIGGQMVRGATDQVAGVAAAYGSLAAIGITTDANGQLQIDSTKLNAALNAGADSVAKLFGGAGGVAQRLTTMIDGLLSSGGAIAARNQNLDDAQKAISDATQRLDDQMAGVQQRYLDQFNALDALMSQLQQTSTFLTQQLANAASIGNGSSTKSG